MQYTDTNVAPYYDDFDKAKKFHRILFQPRTVQTRELTQSQTILQDQIEKFAGHIFKEGSMVIPGGFTISHKDLSISFVVKSGTNLESIKGAAVSGRLTILSRTTGVKMKVDDYIDAVDGEDTRIMGTYDTPGNGNVRQPILNGEDLVFIETPVLGDEREIGYGVVRSSGEGTIAKVNHGVYFVNGFFVEVDTQTHVVSATTKSANARVGFDIVETIVTSDDDPSLLSNAAGTPNERAPGADRLKIELKLNHVDLETTKLNFVDLARVEGGKIITPRIDNQYSLIQDSLAQRTFEESGDYTVDPHEIEIREHLLKDNNEGVYTAELGGKAEKFAVVLKPGISYVRGYRISNDTDHVLTLDKGRDTAVTNNSVASGQYGGYLIASGTSTTMKGAPFSSPNANWKLLNASNTIMGDIRVIAVNWTGSEWHIYIRSVELTGNYKLSDAKKIRCMDGGNIIFEAEVKSKGIVEANKQSKIFQLPAQGIKTLSPQGSSDTTYTVVKDFEMTVDGSGNGTVNSPSGSVFSPNIGNYYVSKKDGSVGKLDAVITLAGTPTGSSLSIKVTGLANDTAHIIAPIIKLQPQPRTKTLIEVTESVVMGSASSPSASVKLGNTDGFSITSVKDSDGKEVKDNFYIDNGQTDTHYDLASLVSKVGPQRGAVLNVTYKYFQHGSGDYFTVDSYTSVDYEEIPVYKGNGGTTYVLHDCIDFRRSVRNGVIDEGDIIQANTTIRSDIEYYLGRVDTVYVTKEGFAVARGISGANPKRPLLPNNAMRLYDLQIPAYTFNVNNVIYYAQNNERFTMRDIGKLKDRIENLEEVTTLNALEQNAVNAQVIDPATGLNRYKNGVFADPMKDARLIDSDDSELNLSIAVDHIEPREITNALDMNHAGGGIVQDKMVMAPYTVENSVSQPFATDFINVNPYASYSWLGSLKLDPSRDFWFDEVEADPIITNQVIDNRGNAKEGVSRSVQVHNSWSSRNLQRLLGWNQGGRMQTTTTTTVKFTESVKTVQGESKVIANEVIPYMREIAIAFKATGMRPNSRLWAWFNGTEVSAHCQPEGKDKGTPIVTDSSGEVNGVFYVPNTETQRFRTGKGNFGMSDSSESLNDESKVTTSAIAPFESGGKRKVTQQEVINIRTLGATVRQKESYKRYDPVCQSFVVPSSGGEFISGVEVFFKTKAKNIPVTMEIRTMENGLPTHEVVARTSLKPSKVKISSTASVGTSFNFDYPVFLEPDREYCFVVLANTQEYHVWYGKMAGTIIGSASRKLTKQPHTGVMFISANGSTWTPMQDADMKFNLKRCRFTEGTTDVLFKSKSGVNDVRMKPTALSVESGKKYVTVNYPIHGLKAGDVVKISGAVDGGFGIPLSEVNKTHTVSSVLDANNFRVATTTEANANGVINAPRVNVSGRHMFSALIADAEVLTVGNTKVTWKVRYKKHDSRAFTPWFDYRLEDVAYLVEEGTFRDVDDLELRATLHVSEYQTPQVDLHGFTTVLLNREIDTNAATFKYVTQDLYFNNPSTGLKLYTGALLPANSDMKLYVKLLREGDVSNQVEWQEVKPTFPIMNDGSVVNEYQYSHDDPNTFSGVKVKIEVTGERTNYPMIRDFRGMAVA